MSLPAFVVTFSAFSMASAAQEFFTAAPADDKPFELMEFGLFADAATSLLQCRVGVRRLTGTVTPGSGGSSFTPLSLGRSGDTFGGTCRVNDTTIATQTGGADSLLLPFAFNALNGLVWLPPPEYRPRFIQGEMMAIRAQTGFGSTVTVSGYAILREMG